MLEVCRGLLKLLREACSITRHLKLCGIMDGGDPGATHIADVDRRKVDQCIIVYFGPRPRTVDCIPRSYNSRPPVVSSGDERYITSGSYGLRAHGFICCCDRAIVIALAYSVLVVCEPSAHSYLAKVLELWLPKKLAEENLNRTIIAFTVVIPSAAVYLALLSSGWYTYCGLKSHRQNSAAYRLLLQTFENWRNLDIAGAFGLAVAVGSYVGGTIMVLKIGAEDPTPILVWFLGVFEGVLCGWSLILSVWDYCKNVRFYGLDLEFDSVLGAAMPAGKARPDEEATDTTVAVATKAEARRKKAGNDANKR
jgi:hypothetical protein